MTLSHAGTGTLDLEVVQYAHRLRFDDLPPSTVERTKMLVLDTIAAVGADGVEAVDAPPTRQGLSPVPWWPPASPAWTSTRRLMPSATPTANAQGTCRVWPRDRSWSRSSRGSRAGLPSPRWNWPASMWVGSGSPVANGGHSRRREKWLWRPATCGPSRSGSTAVGRYPRSEALAGTFGFWWSM